MKKNKKLTMQEQMKYFAAILFLLIFMPILCTVLLSGRSSLKVSQISELEQLLPSIVYREIPDNYRMETICAQAVLARSRVWYEYKKSDYDQKTYDQILEKNLEYERSHHLKTDKLLKCKEAVQQTKGCVLSYGGNVIPAPFCRASNGWTRGGKEVLKSDDYGWLVGVESKDDLDYLPKRKSLSFTNDDLYEKFKTLDQNQQLNKDDIVDHIDLVSEDSSGYAMEVDVSGIKVPGEVFREMLGLPSSSFSFSKKNDKLLITCRGTGHGMGMSQYGANHMAKDGKSWRDILNFYFPNAQIMKQKKKLK
jgi:stage II sporulation protein D